MAVHDITIQQGATFAKTITITDDDDVAINIANDSFRGQVRKKHSSTDTEANFTMTITDGLNGVVQWSLSATDTASMGNGKFYYDLEWVKADGTGNNSNSDC
jgi:antitoxin component of MazEF toxin-antitoxin module